MGCSRFREFCKAKSSVYGIWGHAFGYGGNFFRTCSVRQGGDYLHLLPNLAKEKKYRHLGDKVSLVYVLDMVKESQTDGFCCYLAQFDYGLTLPSRNLAKSVMNMIGACPAQLNCNFWEVILVCKTLNERWAVSSSGSRITAKDFLEYYAVKYVPATDGAYLSSSSLRPCFFNLSSAGRVWNDNLLWVSCECLQRSDEEPLELNIRIITKGKYTIENRTIICILNYIPIVDVYLMWYIFYAGISCKVSRMESFIDFVAKDGTELEAILKKLRINRFKSVASKDDKLARLNKMSDEPVDMATVSNTVVRNLAKRKAVKRGVASHYATSNSVDDSCKRRKVTPPVKSLVVLEETVKIAEGADLRPRFEVETGLMKEQCRAIAREKGVTVVEDEFKKDRSIELERRISLLEGEKNQFEENLTWEREAFQLELEKEREAAALKLKEVRAESVAETKRLASASTTSRNNFLGKLYQLRYTKAEIWAFSERNYEEKEIVDEEEDKEMEDGLNVAEKAVTDNQETTDQEIESLCLRVVDLEGLLEVEKNSSTDLQKELDVPREREEQTLLYNVEYAKEYEALIFQYEDQLDDNVKLSLKIEEAKSQVEDKTATLFSMDLDLNQLISKLTELKE
ncbi:hypothetical protein GIB67_021158 [Kingdonia uniflora]|uniref:Uncharacterized protein n=1 Tax=Kingdonia uniflora TaxID=39325 RepID=A0A7J7N707_9MAGN|nr:hypothetical protein GIB67_021158 [Kingdonia uniflora]